MAPAYQGGAGLLFGANLQAMTAQHASARSQRKQETFEYTGLADVQYLVAGRKENAGQVLNQAELSFSGPPHHIAFWLAAPVPVGDFQMLPFARADRFCLVAQDPPPLLDRVLGLSCA